MGKSKPDWYPAGSPKKAERRAESLATGLVERKGQPPDTLALTAASKARADALIYHLVKQNGDVRGALRLAGYPVDAMTDAELRTKFEREFEAPHAVHALARHLARMEGGRERAISTLEEIMLTSEDENARLKAVALYAKIGGWNAPTKVQLDTRSTSLTLHSIVKAVEDPAAWDQFIAETSHEPGAARRVTTGNDRLDALTGAAEEGDP